MDNCAEPTPGMIIFFDWDSPNRFSEPQDGLSNQASIVEQVENGRVWIFEGNTGDICREKSYPFGYYEILGLRYPGILRKQPPNIGGCTHSGDLNSILNIQQE